jgi:RNA polymerase sigma factor (sigma-70 family)
MSDYKSDNQRIRVAIVDDEAEIRSSLRALLQQSPGVHVLHCCDSPQTALEEIPKNCPDVVLMDIHMPEMSGIECVIRLKLLCPQVHFLMLTVYEDAEKIFKSLAAGANGYLLKRASPEQLVQAIHETAAGGSALTAQVARKVVQHFQKQNSQQHLDNLTERELEVLKLLSKGLLYKEIADQLTISVDTVNKHVSHTYRKLQVRTRTEAVLKLLNQ